MVNIDPAYLAAVSAAESLPPELYRWCPDCRRSPTGGGTHIMAHGYVVRGCSGDLTVDPASVGLPGEAWQDWRVVGSGGTRCWRCGSRNTRYDLTDVAVGLGRVEKAYMTVPWECGDCGYAWYNVYGHRASVPMPESGVSV